MKLAELIERNPGISLATEADNEELNLFFENAPMKGNEIELSYKRRPNFFQLLKFQSDDFFVFNYREKGELMAVGTLILRQGTIDGRNTIVGYLGDLRVRNYKAALIAWRQFYNDLIIHFEEIEEFKRANYLLTAVIDSNQSARKALINQSKQKFQYHLIKNYTMVNIFRSFDFFHQFDPHLTIEWTNLSLDQELQEFIEDEHRKLSFGLIPHEIERRQKIWPRTNGQVALKVKKEGKLVAYTFLWSPSPEKKIIVEKFPKSILLALNLIARQKLKIKDEFKVMYLNALTIDSDLSKSERNEIMRFIVHSSFQSKIMKGFHVLAFANFKDKSLLEGLKRYVKFETPMTLYQVIPRHRFEELSLRENTPLFFEMSLV